MTLKRCEECGSKQAVIGEVVQCLKCGHTAPDVADWNRRAKGDEAMTPLLPCPFCDGTATHVIGSAKPPAHYVMCISCNATTAMRAIAPDAAEDWNRRAAQSAPDRDSVIADVGPNHPEYAEPFNAKPADEERRKHK